MMTTRAGLLGLGVAVLVGCGGSDPVEGPAGVRGADGTQGKQGDPGPKGDVGPAGPAGVAGAAGKDAAVDGSRLHAINIVGDDGSRAFSGWHDTTLDVDCAYSTAADGKTRCLPSNATGQVLFSDAACTQGVLVIDPQCIAPAYARLAAQKICGSGGAHLFKVGALLASPPAKVYGFTGMGQCAVYGLPIGDFYDAGAELAPSMFVLGTSMQN